jgi:hypothetical protein
VPRRRSPPLERGLKLSTRTSDTGHVPPGGGGVGVVKRALMVGPGWGHARAAAPAPPPREAEGGDGETCTSMPASPYPSLIPPASPSLNPGLPPASPSFNTAPSPAEVATRQLKLVGEWEAHEDAVWALAYGGGCVFSGSHAGVIKQWNAARSWSCVRAVQVFFSFFFFSVKKRRRHPVECHLRCVFFFVCVRARERTCVCVALRQRCVKYTLRRFYFVLGTWFYFLFLGTL